MRRPALRFLSLLALAASLCACSSQTSFAQQAEQNQHAEAKSVQDELPSFDAIEGVVRRSFATVPEWRKGDLITRSQAETVCQDVRTFGWKSFDRKALLTDVLADNAFLAKELRTKKGRAFMAEIAPLPNGYDRLDHLSRLPQGRQTVHDLINGVGGDELIVYLTTSQGGTELGKMLSQDPNGKNFNKPTGRIYTAEDFLARLKVEYQQEQERLRKQQKSSGK